jgi:hypothetical protein
VPSHGLHHVNPRRQHLMLAGAIAERAIFAVIGVTLGAITRKTAEPSPLASTWVASSHPCSSTAPPQGAKWLPSGEAKPRPHDPRPRDAAPSTGRHRRPRHLRRRLAITRRPRRHPPPRPVRPASAPADTDRPVRPADGRGDHLRWIAAGCRCRVGCSCREGFAAGSCFACLIRGASG